jgi:hypothetical protein
MRYFMMHAGVVDARDGGISSTDTSENGDRPKIKKRRPSSECSCVTTRLLCGYPKKGSCAKP